MRYLTKQWYLSMQTWPWKVSSENQEDMEQRMEACNAAERASFAGTDDSILDEFSFHDETVHSFQQVDGDWVIDFGGCAEGYSQVRYLRFKNAVIQKQDRDLSGGWWLYEELYKTEKGYEVHILLDRNGLLECVLTCEDVLMEGEAG